MKYAALALVLSAGAASAECFPTQNVYAVIGGEFKEYRSGAGMTPDMSAWVELWINPETGSFTLMATLPSGQSCIIATGEAWNEFEAPPQL